MLAALFITALALQAPARPAVLEGAHFRLHCHFEHRPSAERALQIVEATVPVARALFGEVAGGALLDVHLYRNTVDYEAAEARLTGGAFRRNLAFAHFDTRSAHVALQPDLSDAALHVVGLTWQTQRLLAHEAAHLLRYATMRNHRSHPDWFADGSASWVETQVLQGLGLLEEIEASPHYATKVIRAQRAGERLPSVDALLLDDVDELEFYERYAVRWLAFRFLRERHAAELRQLIDAIHRAGGGGDVVRRVHTQARGVFGAAAFAELDAGFVTFVRMLQPQWEETLAALETNGVDWQQTAFDRNALAWRTEPAGDDHRLAGALRILPGVGEQMNVLLGRHAGGFLSVALRPGSVTVFEYDAGADAWTRLQEASAAGLVLDQAVPFRVQIAGSTLRVDIAGQRVLELDVPRRLDGAWGLGAQARAAGVWSSLEFSSEIEARPASARRR